MKNKRTIKNKRKQTRKTKNRRPKRGGMFSSVTARSAARLSNRAPSIAPSLASIRDLSSKKEYSELTNLPAYFQQRPPPPPPKFHTGPKKNYLASATQKAAERLKLAKVVVDFNPHLAATAKTATLATKILTKPRFIMNTIPLIISVSVNTDWNDMDKVNTYYKQLFGLLEPVIRAAVSKKDLNTRTLAPKLIEQMVEKGSLAEKILNKIFEKNSRFKEGLDQAADLFDKLIPEIWNHLKTKGVNCNLTTSPLYSQEEQIADLKHKIKDCIGVKAYNIGSEYEHTIRTFLINKTGGFLYEMFDGIQMMLQQSDDYEDVMEIDIDKFKIETSIAEKLDATLTNTILSAFIVDVQKINTDVEKEKPTQKVITGINGVVEKEFQKVTVGQLIMFDEKVLTQLISKIYHEILAQEKMGLPYTVTDCILESIDLRLSSLLGITPAAARIYNQPTLEKCIEELEKYFDEYTDMQKQILASYITSRANELFVPNKGYKSFFE
jgi:hypothetical protein